MPIRTASDIVCTLIAWSPLLAIAVAVVIFFSGGIAQLELRSDGTDYMVPHGPSVRPDVEGGTAAIEAELEAALASGDTARMAAALDRLDHASAQQPALASTPGY